MQSKFARSIEIRLLHDTHHLCHEFLAAITHHLLRQQHDQAGVCTGLQYAIENSKHALIANLH